MCLLFFTYVFRADGHKMSRSTRKPTLWTHVMYRQDQPAQSAQSNPGREVERGIAY